jgi:hypothetical protein
LIFLFFFVVNAKNIDHLQKIIEYNDEKSEKGTASNFDEREITKKRSKVCVAFTDKQKKPQQLILGMKTLQSIHLGQSILHSSIENRVFQKMFFYKILVTYIPLGRGLSGPYGV